MSTTTGVVVGWNEDKGYGFVRPSEGGGADIFIHRLDIKNAVMLSQGQKVSFEIIMDERKGKPRAAQLRLLDEDHCAALARAWPEDRSNARYR